jgi:hypothetical protein
MSKTSTTARPALLATVLAHVGQAFTLTLYEGRASDPHGYCMTCARRAWCDCQRKAAVANWAAKRWPGKVDPVSYRGV